MLITSSDLVPLIIAIKEPSFPFAALLVIIVYKSPLLKAVSSIDTRFPIFSGNINQSSA